MAALALAVLYPWPGYAATATCRAAVEEQLSRLNIDPANVADVSYLRRVAGRRGGDRIIGLDAWINLKSCQGALIVALSRSCGVQQVYTRNNCKVPGLDNY